MSLSKAEPRCADIPLFGFQRSEASNLSADATALVGDGLLSSGFAVSDYKNVKIADEPGWYYPATYVTAANDSTTIAHWHALLRDTAQLEPADLLAGAKSWGEIAFAGRSVANSTIQDRRRFYWTTRMFSLESAHFFQNATRTFEAMLGEGGPAVYANWNNFASRMYTPGDNGGESHNPARTDPNEASAAHDWFDFGRARGASILWTEDWNAPARWWSFQGSKLAAAGSLSGIEWGGYIVPRAAALKARDMVQRVATIVGSGGKGITYYNFGPDYMFPVSNHNHLTLVPGTYIYSITGTPVTCTCALFVRPR